MITYYYFRVMSIFLYFVPYEVIDFFSFVIGNLIYFSNNWRVESIKKNLNRIGIFDFNLKEIFVNMVRNHFDLLKSYYLKQEYLLKITDLSNVDLVRLKNDKYILITAHYGNWELAGIIFGYLVKNTVSVAELKGVGEKRYKALLRFRNLTGMKIFPLEDPKTIIKLEEHLQKGYIPVLLFDRDITKTGTLCDFGNSKVFIPKGPFYFGKKFSKDIMFGTFFYIKNRRYRYFALIKEVERDENLKRYAENGLKVLFDVIKRKPEEWFAFSMRWE